MDLGGPETRRDASKLKSRDETRRQDPIFQKPRRETRRETSRLVFVSRSRDEASSRLVALYPKNQGFLVLENMEFSCVFEVFWAFFSEKLTKFETRS